MRIIGLPICILCIWAQCLRAAAETRIIDIASIPLAAGQDMSPIMYDMIKSAGEGDLKIVFPKGVYHFYPDRAFGKYHEVTNHDNGYKFFAFPIVGMDRVTVDGGGSSFIFHGVITPFLVENSREVTLENFSVDWEEPFYIQGTVVRSEPGSQAMEIEFTRFSKEFAEGGRLAMDNNGVVHPFPGECMVFDPVRRAVAYRAQDYLISGIRTKTLEVKPLGGKKYRFEGRFAKRPAPEGMVYVFKGMNGSNRLAPGIHVTGSRGFTIRNVTMHHAGGMGLIGERSEDIHLDSFHVTLPEGSDRLVTTTADATHFCNCKGRLLIENCVFENMLDDATNVHGTYMRVGEILSPRVLTARLIHHQQTGYDFAGAGDRLRFVAFETMLPAGENRLVSLERINHAYYRLEFENDLPHGLKTDDGIENITWYPEFTFRHNVVRNNRARSILISTRNKTVVEHNTFSSMMTSILFEGDLEHWHESGAVDDVVIRDNLFLDNAYGGNQGYVIWINPRMRKTIPDRPFESNIRIENNTFHTFDPAIINARSTGGLVIRGNTVKPSGTFDPIRPDAASFTLRDCPGAVIKKNKISGEGVLTLDMDDTSAATVKHDVF